MEASLEALEEKGRKAKSAVSERRIFMV